MSITAIVEALVLAGATPEMILAAVRAAETQDSNAIEQRRASDRERQARRRHVMSRDVTVTPCDTPVSDKESPPAPPKEINSTPKHSSLRSEPVKRATRLPADFEPDFGFATSQGLTASQARAEAEKFVDFWTAKSGQDATKLDWPATWRNWIRNSKSRGPSRGPPRKSDYQQRLDDVMRNLDEAQGIYHDDREFAGTTIDL